MPTKKIRSITLCAVAALSISVSSCQGAQSADKSGANTVVLKLATIDGVNDNGQSFGPQAFVDSLGKVSGGRLKVDVVDNYGGGAADSESKVVQAIASGEIDGGWPSVRAFAGGGIAGLEAVEAPMTITSYAAEKALVSGPVAGQLLAQLDGTGVVGLGLAVGPLRRPFAANAPLLGPADWKGARFRAFNSTVQAGAIRALGGIPANLGFSWVDEVHAGTLRGVEFDIPQYAVNDASGGVGNVTANVVLWPKVFVLSISKKRFQSLTSQQQGWVRDAAAQAVAASVDANYDESTPASNLCVEGVRFVSASPQQLTDLRAALAPVLNTLAADPKNGPLLRQVQAVAAAHPETDVPSVPASCHQVTVQPGTVGPIPAEVSTLPDGIYRAEITRAEAATAGMAMTDGPAGIWTLTVRHGTYQGNCRPLTADGRDCGNADRTDIPVEVGDLRGSDHAVYFVPNAERLAKLIGCKLPPSSTLADHCGPTDPYRENWAIQGKNLIFKNYVGPGGKNIFDVKPWLKIG